MNGTLLFLGIAWVVYGVLSIIGRGNVPYIYRNHSWTNQYKKEKGIGFVILGASWSLLYMFMKGREVSLLISVVLMLAVALPALIYSINVEKKYKSKLNEK